MKLTTTLCLTIAVLLGSTFAGSMFWSEPVLADHYKAHGVNSVKMTCKISGFSGNASLEVDISKNWFVYRGVLHSRVVINSEYITAFEDVKEGGSITMLSRQTGELWRAHIRKMCRTRKCESTYIDSWTEKGMCKKVLL